MNEGKFIVLEGPDGSGKSTQARLLVEALRKRGLAVDHLRDPGGTAAGDAIRSVLLGGIPLDRTTETFLFLASRAQLVVETIRPALSAGRVIVCERYFPSTLVYQGLAAGLPADALALLRTVVEASADGVLPDALLVLDVEEGAGLRRIAEEGRALDRIERKGPAYQALVRDGYRWVVANCPGARAVPAGSVEEVHRAVLAIVEETLRGR
jgi:dTMP kinase